MMLRRLSLRPALARLIGDERGAAVVETAIIAPVLALLAIGSYDMSRMIARQHDLQGGASDVEGIILAVATGPSTNVQKIEQVLEASLDLTNSGSVTVVKRFRCGVAADLVTAANLCDNDDTVATYVQVTLTETYTPTWRKFGIGGDMDYNFVRTIQIS